MLSARIKREHCSETGQPFNAWCPLKGRTYLNNVPVVFPKKFSYRERVKPCFFVTCTIIISHIILENSLKFLNSFRKFEDFLSQY